MARILLGVSGGIAAYKSLELARLATVAGHGVRVVMTEAAQRFVGAASFEGIVGAPVLSSEFERDPLRGAFPGDPRAGARPDRPPRAGRQLRRLPRRAGLGQHDRQARRRDRRLDAHHLLPRLHGAAPRRAGDERPHVRRRGDPGQPGDPARAGGRGDRAGRGRPRLARRARHAAGCPTRPSCSPRIEAVLPQGERPWDGLRVLVTAGGTREPIDPVRFIGNRSSGRMGIALAAAAARRGADVTLIAANVALPEPAGVRRIDVETTAQLAEACRSEFPESHLLLMAAAPADFTPTGPAVGQAQAPRLPGPPPGADRGHPRRLAPHAARGRPSSASPPNTATTSPAPATSSTRKGLDLIVLNDVSNPDIGFDSPENAATLISSSGETPLPQASKDVIAEQILDRVERDPGRCKERAILSASFLSLSSIEKWAWPTFFTARTRHGRPQRQHPAAALRARFRARSRRARAARHRIAAPLHRPPLGGRPGALRAGHQASRELRAEYSLEVSSPGPKYRKEEQ